MCGVTVDRLEHDELVRCVATQLHRPRQAPLALGSVNLDHVHHFGSHRGVTDELGHRIEWLMLIDGAPVAARASAVTGEPWPRLTGADLLPDLLSVAERAGARVGFLGGQLESIPGLRDTLTARWPDLDIAGFWTPPRSTVDTPSASDQLADAIAATGVELLVVGLGKPRQERWIEVHGTRTGASVLLGFGASADFLAGSARRAPRWMRSAGLEWLFRLLQEPRRLARRYLVEGPPALRALRRAQGTVTYRENPIESVSRPAPSRRAPSPSPRS